jgi:hypothetical protein
MGVLDRATAEKEVKAWLDFKKYSQKKRELKANVEAIAKLVEAFEEGLLVLDPETFVITQNLMFPIGVDIKTNCLKFKARIPYANIATELKGVPTDDIGKFTAAYIAAATGEVKGVILQLDTEDYAVAQSLAGFFQ